MDRLIMFIATGGGIGRIPFAPGTFGTIPGLLIHWLIFRLDPPFYLAVFAAITVIAILTAGGAEKILDRADPGSVVIDEIAGVLVALAFLPPTPLNLAAAFILFRIFDIAKPFPVGWFDRNLHGGPGIVIDDLAAGAMAWAVIQLGRYLATFI